MKVRSERFCVFVLLAIFALASLASVGQGTEKRVWRYFDVGFDTPTFAYKETSVYAEPSLKSKIVGRLKKSPEGEWDVAVQFAKILTDGKKSDYTIYETWWYISEPVSGWVEGPNLGIFNSGFFGQD